MFTARFRPVFTSAQLFRVKAPRQFTSIARLPNASLPIKSSPGLQPSFIYLSLRNMTGTPAGTSPKGALTAAIAEDHQEMYEYYDQFKFARSEGDNDKAERWARQLIWEVARHAVGEEIVVYPLMEKHLGEQGLKLANEDRNDHQFVKNRLYKIESERVGSEGYGSLLEEIMQHLHRHNDNEETKDLPLLEPAIGPEDSEKAAHSFKRTKKFVPTRPHPSAPNHPPLETFAGFLAAPIDKLKDVFVKFPTEEMKEEVRS